MQIREIDELYPIAYWNLRYISLLELDKAHKVLLKDCYVLLANIEMMYYLDAKDLFVGEEHLDTYYNNHIKPYLYTFEIMKKLRKSNSFKMITLDSFYDLYKLRRPSISSIGEEKDILKKVRVHEKYLTHPVSLRKVAKPINTESIRKHKNVN